MSTETGHRIFFNRRILHRDATIIYRTKRGQNFAFMIRQPPTYPYFKDLHFTQEDLYFFDGKYTPNYPEEIDMDGWIIDVNAREARHISGLTLAFEGRPGTDHFTGSLRSYSKQMQPLELSRLIREGFAHYEAEVNRHFVAKSSVSGLLDMETFPLSSLRVGPLHSSSAPRLH